MNHQFVEPQTGELQTGELQTGEAPVCERPGWPEPEGVIPLSARQREARSVADRERNP